MTINNQTVLHFGETPSTIRELTAYLLRRDHDVVSVNDPATFLDQVHDGAYRVVLFELDAHEGRGGLSLLRDVKQQDGSIQVIALALSVPLLTAMQAMRLGVESFFFKPINDAQAVCDAVETAFEKIDQWWVFLNELSNRKHSAQRVAAIAGANQE